MKIAEHQKLLNSIKKHLPEARFFLEMMHKYGRKFKNAPELLPSGWAALLYLYNVR